MNIKDINQLFDMIDKSLVYLNSEDLNKVLNKLDSLLNNTKQLIANLEILSKVMIYQDHDSYLGNDDLYYFQNKPKVKYIKNDLSEYKDQLKKIDFEELTKDIKIIETIKNWEDAVNYVLKENKNFFHSTCTLRKSELEEKSICIGTDNNSLYLTPTDAIKYLNDTYVFKQ